MSAGVRPQLLEGDFGTWSCSECEWLTTLDAKALWRAWRAHLKAAHPDWNANPLTAYARREAATPGLAVPDHLKPWRRP